MVLSRRNKNVHQNTIPNRFFRCFEEAIGVIYLSIAVMLLVPLAVKEVKKTKQAMKGSGRMALTVFPVLFLR